MKTSRGVVVVATAFVLVGWWTPAWTAGADASQPSGTAQAVTTLPTRTVTYTYDADGRLASADYGQGRVVSYTYDKVGNLLTRNTAVGQVVPGDVNGDGVVNVGDAFYLINYLFAGGPSPQGSGDVNGDGVVNVSDVFYLINYLFAGGPAPV